MKIVPLFWSYGVVFVAFVRSFDRFVPIFTVATVKRWAENGVRTVRSNARKWWSYRCSDGTLAIFVWSLYRNHDRIVILTLRWWFVGDITIVAMRYRNDDDITFSMERKRYYFVFDGEKTMFRNCPVRKFNYIEILIAICLGNDDILPTNAIFLIRRDFVGSM